MSLNAVHFSIVGLNGKSPLSEISWDCFCLVFAGFRLALVENLYPPNYSGKRTTIFNNM